MFDMLNQCYRYPTDICSSHVIRSLDRHYDPSLHYLGRNRQESHLGTAAYLTLGLCTLLPYPLVNSVGYGVACTWNSFCEACFEERLDAP